MGVTSRGFSMIRIVAGWIVTMGVATRGVATLGFI